MFSTPSSPKLQHSTAPVTANRLKRFLFHCLAVLSLAIAMLGLVLPGLPSTEFILLAAWAAARSSPRLHAWIMRHRLFGPLLADWQKGRLPRRAKWAATIAMTVTAIIMAAFVTHLPSVVISISCMAIVLIWLWRRPEQ